MCVCVWVCAGAHEYMNVAHALACPGAHARTRGVRELAADGCEKLEDPGPHFRPAGEEEVVKVGGVPLADGDQLTLVDEATEFGGRVDVIPLPQGQVVGDEGWAVRIALRVSGLRVSLLLGGMSSPQTLGHMGKGLGQVVHDKV